MVRLLTSSYLVFICASVNAETLACEPITHGSPWFLPTTLSLNYDNGAMNSAELGFSEADFRIKGEWLSQGHDHTASFVSNTDSKRIELQLNSKALDRKMLWVWARPNKASGAKAAVYKCEKSSNTKMLAENISDDMSEKEPSIELAQSGQNSTKNYESSRLDIESESCATISDRTSKIDKEPSGISEITSAIKKRMRLKNCGIDLAKPARTSVLTPEVSAINRTTDTFLKNKYMCMAATVPQIRPELQQDDLYRAGDVLLLDLTGDGKPETVHGLQGTYHKDPNNPLLSQKPSQFLFYSSSKDFKIPRKTKFMNARTMLAQDLNGDGRDDAVFVQHGPDYRPYMKPHSNKVMMSSESGYTVSVLPGKKALYHGGAAGDIDNDGDVDIVVTPGSGSRIYAYLNKGNGKFNTKFLTWNKDHERNIVKLWDVDDDGFLDLVTKSKKAYLQIFWGDGTEDYFKKPPTEMIREKEMFGGGVMDVAFGIKTNEFFISSTSDYKSFEIIKVSLTNRQIVEETVVNHGTGDWVPFLNSCDLQADGDIDLIAYGQGQEAWSLWINDRNVSDIEFLLVKLPHVGILKDNSNKANLLALREVYEYFGVSYETYAPTTIFFPDEKYNKKSFYHLVDGGLMKYCRQFADICRFAASLPEN